MTKNILNSTSFHKLYSKQETQIRRKIVQTVQIKQLDMEYDARFRENDAFGCMGHSESVMIKLMEKRLDLGHAL